MNNIIQDWTTVTWDKRGQKDKNETQKQYMAKQLRTNNVISKPKLESLNTQAIKPTNLTKIANEEDTFKHATVSLSMSKKISQLRCEKKLTQKELAFQLSLPVKIIQDYEAGKAIPNANIINKIEKILGRVR